MPRRVGRWLPFLCLWAIFIVGPKLLGCTRAPKGGMRATVRLLWLDQSQFAGVYAATRQGYYERDGIDATALPGGPGVNPVRLVASGSEQIGICSATDIILARAKGIPIRSLAIVIPGNPTCFFAKEASGIRSVQDFRGKRVGVKEGFELEYYLTAMLKKAGVGESEIKRVPIQFDMTPFFRGDVDVWCGYRINEPNIARSNGVEVTEILPENYGVKVAGDVLFTTEDFYRAHGSLCRSFVEDTWLGWKYAAQHPDTAVAYVLARSPNSNAAHERAMLNSVLPMVLTTGRTRLDDQTASQWQEMIAFLTVQKVLTSPVKATECFWQ